MPTVDTAFAQPAPPVTVTSPDGLLTATVDAANGGVLLFANLGSTPGSLVATNLAPNPSAEVGTAGLLSYGSGGTAATFARFTAGNFTHPNDPAVTSMFRVSFSTAPAGSSGFVEQVSVVAGKAYVVAGWFRQNGGSTPMALAVQTVVAGSNFTSAGAWTRQVLKFTPSTSGVLNIGARLSGADVAGTTFDVAGFVVAEGVTDPGYFNPTAAPDGTYTYAWTGTVGNSPSQKWTVATPPDKVRFYRGDGTLVRSGDPAWAPGGTAVAYDHEAPVGGSVAYYAVPETLSGAQGAATATLGIPNPWTGDSSDVWIKSPTNPGASIRVQAAAFEETARPLRTSMSPISGATLGISSYDVTGGLTGTLTVYTDGKAEYDAMLALLDGSPLLIQSDPERAGIPLQWYAQPVGDALSLRRVETGTGWGMRSWPLQLQEVRRPATLDAPLMIPGNSYDTPPYVSYDAAKATGLSYNALLGVS